MEVSSTVLYPGMTISSVTLYPGMETGGDNWQIGGVRILGGNLPWTNNLNVDGTWGLSFDAVQEPVT